MTDENKPAIVYLDDVLDTWLKIKNSYSPPAFITLDPYSNPQLQAAIDFAKGQYITKWGYDEYTWTLYLRGLFRKLATCNLKDLKLLNNGSMIPNTAICAATQYYDNYSEVEDKSLFEYTTKTNDTIEIAVTQGIKIGSEMKVTIKEIFELGTSIEIELSTTKIQSQSVEQEWNISQDISMVPKKRTIVNWLIDKESGSKILKGTLELSGNVFVYFLDPNGNGWLMQSRPIGWIIDDLNEAVTVRGIKLPDDVKEMLKNIKVDAVDKSKANMDFEANVNVKWAVESILQKNVLELPNPNPPTK